jgi:hypothetical protein
MATHVNNSGRPLNNTNSSSIFQNRPHPPSVRTTPYGNINPEQYIQSSINVKTAPAREYDNDAKTLTTTLNSQGIRDNRFNYYKGLYNIGYPEVNSFDFCGSQRLSSSFKLGGQFWSYGSIRKQNDNFQNVIDNAQNPFSCNPSVQGCAGVIPCAPNQMFDSVSCLCVELPFCPPPCEETVINQEFKIDPITNTVNIKGYAFYSSGARDLEIPEIGTRPASCFGGHVCCSTLFRAQLIFANNTTLDANRDISMNNINVCEHSDDQIPPSGWTGSLYERADTFEFNVPANSIDQIIGSSVALKCQLAGCHSGVTQVTLVAETTTGEYILIFDSCVTPGATYAKPIGTIECAEPEPCYDTVQYINNIP